MPGVADYFSAELQAQIIKWLAGIGILLAIVTGSYLLGRHDGKQNCLGALKTVAAHVADQRANNAIDATKRLGEYNTKDRALEVGIAEALDQVHQYYVDHPEVETKLVVVPGKKEKVYVPTITCPSTYLSPDELQLYNVGNKRSDLDTGNSK